MGGAVRYFSANNGGFLKMPAYIIARCSLGALLAALLVAAPAEGQRQGNQKQSERQRADEVRRQGNQRPELSRRGDVWEVRQPGTNGRRLENGPPFCRNGQGHPVHGRRWCEEKGYGMYGSVLDQRAQRTSRSGDWGRHSSYEEAHAAFHRQHDQQCRARAAERPLDVQWQLRVRNECRQRHEEWHARAGRAH